MSLYKTQSFWELIWLENFVQWSSFAERYYDALAGINFEQYNVVCLVSLDSSY